jgi:ribosomal protein S12 methylthiotransferase accessory factor
MMPTDTVSALTEDKVFIFSASAEIRTRLAAASGTGQVHAYADPADSAAFEHMRSAGAGGVGIVAVEGQLLFFPVGGGTCACVACLQQARLAQRIPQELTAHRQGTAIDLCAPAHLSAFALERVAALRAFMRSNAATGAGAGAEGIALDLVTLATTRFALHGQRNCPLCGDTGAPAQEPPTPPTPLQPPPARSLQHRQKRHPGAYRCKQLGEYAIDLARYINPVNGLLGKTLLQNRELPFYALTSGRFFESEVARETPIDWFGSAQTYRDSAIVGIFEGLERRAGLLARERGAGVRASYAEAAGVALHPASLGLYEEATYADDPRLLRFDERLPLDWVWGHSMARRAPVLVPSDFVYYGSRQMIYGNSSGCATGSCVEEALLFGLLETIERDAFMMHWLARLAPCRIALDSIEDIECKTIITRLVAAGATLHLLDARLDLPVPVVLAVIVRAPGEFGAFSLAAGASFDPADAIRRALGEVAVHFHGFEERSRRAAEGNRDSADFGSVKGIEDHALFYGQPQALPLARFLVESPIERSYADTYAAWNAQRPASLSLLDDLEFFFGLLKAAGHDDVVWVDQSSPEQAQLGLRTVRAIVPGLLPIDFGHGRCRAATLPRLFELPHRLGLRAAPLCADDINRTPHPFP